MSKKRLKVGDIVRFNPDDCAGWTSIFSMVSPYRITEIHKSIDQPGTLCCILVEMDGSEAIPMTDDVDCQPWDCWLIKDQFLSAVHQRKGKRKHAAKV